MKRFENTDSHLCAVHSPADVLPSTYCLKTRHQPVSIHTGFEFNTETWTMKSAFARTTITNYDFLYKTAHQQGLPFINPQMNKQFFFFRKSNLMNSIAGSYHKFFIQIQCSQQEKEQKKNENKGVFVLATGNNASLSFHFACTGV